MTLDIQKVIEKPLKTTVNAFCCFGESTSSSKIILEKSHYYAGEPLKIRIECDNSACSRDIIGFDIALQRHYQVTGNLYSHGHSYTDYESLGADYETIVSKDEKGLGAH